MDSALDAVVPLFRSHHKFVLSTHVNPDGDGLGSEVALAEWLLSQGKQVSVINHSVTPDFYLFLDPNSRITKFDKTRDALAIASADVIVVMDTNQSDRLMTMEPYVLTSKATKICIDHHLEPSPFAQHYVIDADATSTGEIVYKLLMRMNEASISTPIASALFCAIMTDTGSFRYPRVDPETFRICAHLIESGADPVAIYQQVYEQWTPGRMELLGDALANLHTEYDGKLAHITITQEFLRNTGTTEVDTDNFTTYPMSVKGVVAGILFLELGNGVKMSFRSKGDIPINELAKEFGGNGHKNAAGARLYDVKLEDVRTQVLAAARKYLTNHIR
jgi:bifunctional oligoribonuclease and PAP phosphatase NrnA